MGIWSRPLFTNRPEWKVKLGWFVEGSACSSLIHYSFIIDNDEIAEGKEMTLGEFVNERIHENSKIYGHLAHDQMRGWQHFFELLSEHNKSDVMKCQDVDIHLYNVDEEHPYRFSYRGGSRELLLYVYPPGNVYYSELKRDYVNGYSENRYRVVKFIEDKYRRNYTHVPITHSDNITMRLNQPRSTYLF